MSCLSVQYHFCYGLSDGAREFEAVAGTCADYYDVLVLGVVIDYEVFVGRVCVEAGCGGNEGAASPWYVAFQETPHWGFVLFRHVSADGVGRRVLAAVMSCNLHAFA